MMLRNAMANLAALILSVSAAHAATVFDIEFSSAQEVAPGGAAAVEERAFGEARLRQEGDAFALDFDLFFDSEFDFAPILDSPTFPFTLPTGNIGDIDATSGLDVTRLHIHNANRGENGPVVFGLINPGLNLDGDIFVEEFLGATRVSGTWDANEGVEGGTLADFTSILTGLRTGEDAPLYVNLHTANDPAGAIRGQLVAANDTLVPVPVPAAFPLLLGGLAALGMVSRRRKEKS